MMPGNWIHLEETSHTCVGLDADCQLVAELRMPSQTQEVVCSFSISTLSSLGFLTALWLGFKNENPKE